MTIELLQAKIKELEIELRAKQIADLQPIRLNQDQAALYLGFETGRCLEQYRANGTGPRFQKIGQRVFYLRTHLDEWANSLPVFSNSAEAKYQAQQRR